MNETPEALRLAADLGAYHTRSSHKQASAELRRQHALIEELRDALEAIVISAAANQAAINYPLIDDARAALAKAEAQ
jgi:hypothetical protein